MNTQFQIYPTKSSHKRYSATAFDITTNEPILLVLSESSVLRIKESLDSMQKKQTNLIQKIVRWLAKKVGLTIEKSVTIHIKKGQNTYVFS